MMGEASTSTTATATTTAVSINISADPAGGYAPNCNNNGNNNNNGNKNGKNNGNKNGKKKTGSMSSFLSSISSMIQLLCWIFRFMVLDTSLIILFAMFVFSVVVHKIHDNYLYPQLQLMLFQEENRQFTDTTYYHRYCDGDDFTATSHLELMIPDNFTTEDSVQHMLTHGASIYPNLLTNETATELRDWIDRENHIREGWNVIENKNRYSWGIDMNMHPTLQTFWQELAANEKLINGLQAIVGADPAIIEFTAITSSYGAEDQYMHADVIPSASATKFARSFLTSYSLFIPLQDTTYEMGATHVCPGSHVCSGGADDHCDDFDLAMSGRDEGGIWSMGAGALLNQQTYHKGMGFTQEGAIDRVVLIATFAPRPNFRNGMETRQIGQGGSYSLLWHQWGHTFSDYVNADKRMTEPQKTLRSLGLIKGNGWNYLSSLSMRMANEDTGMRSHDLEEFVEEEGGIWFLPRSWQEVDEVSDISEWHAFSFGVLKRVEFEFERVYLVALVVYLSICFLWVTVQRALGIGKSSKQSIFVIALRFVFRIVATHGLVVILAWFALNTIEDSNWAKSIRGRKLYRIPVADVDNPASSTVPHKTDILFIPHYTSDYLASYARVVDFAHPGNLYWKTITKRYAAGYATLSPNLQNDFCVSLLVEVTRERRFLNQDEERFWTEVVDGDELVTSCHRELRIAFDPLLEAMLWQIDSLQSETKFGRFRETAMQTKIIPDYLRSWDNRLLADNSKKVIPNQAFATKPKQTTKTGGFGPVIYSQVQVESLTTKRTSTFPLRRPTIPPEPERSEPYDGSWLKEGDRVEGLFRCDEENGEWFSGTITAAIPNDGTYDILYDDGDTDEGLADDCVQRLYPYE